MSLKLKSKNAFHFPIPIDPLRVLYGVRQCWIWFLILPVIFGIIGWLVGGTQSENRYSVSLQLIKLDVPNTLQTSETGQAFKPRDLSDDTLLSTTYSNEVLKRTGERVEPKRSASEVKAMVEIAKQRNTSLFYLTVHSRVSPEDAISTVNVWADEIIRFTDKLQQEEARNMEAFISEQLDLVEVQLQQVNQQILTFAKQENFVDVDSQTESALTALEDVRMRLSTAEIELEAKGVQINRYMDELRAQSPLEADLKRKREELTTLRGRYTDANPLVKEKLYEIDFINKQLIAKAENPSESLKDFTGSDLGNDLYLVVIDLENERTRLEKMVANYRLRLIEREVQVAGIPEKALRLMELKSRRDLLVEAQSLLESRRKEASFFKTRAPGYWQVFQQPSLGEVIHSSQNIKALLLGLNGFVAGLVIAFLAAVFWETLQPGLRTPLGAAIATASLPLFSYVTRNATKRSWWNQHLFPRSKSEGNEYSLRSFWLTHAGNSGDAPLRRFLFAHTDQCVDEVVFWRALLDMIHEEGSQVVFCKVGELGDPEMESLSAHPAVAQWTDDLSAAVNVSEYYVLVYLNRVPTVKEVPNLSKLDAYFLINSPSISDRSETSYTSSLLRKLLGPAYGLLIVDQSAGRSLPRILDLLEMRILHYFVKRQGKEGDQ